MKALIFDREEQEVACSWHGGQSSMLYAVCSTGTLALGSRRPRGMSDEEWFESLAEDLATEAEQAADEARKQAKSARGKEKKELLRDLSVLTRIVEMAENYKEYWYDDED